MPTGSPPALLPGTRKRRGHERRLKRYPPALLPGDEGRMRRRLPSCAGQGKDIPRPAARPRLCSRQRSNGDALHLPSCAPPPVSSVFIPPRPSCARPRLSPAGVPSVRPCVRAPARICLSTSLLRPYPPPALLRTSASASARPSSRPPARTHARTSLHLPHSAQAADARRAPARGGVGGGGGGGGGLEAWPDRPRAIESLERAFALEERNPRYHIITPDTCLPVSARDNVIAGLGFRV